MLALTASDGAALRGSFVGVVGGKDDGGEDEEKDEDDDDEDEDEKKYFILVKSGDVTVSRGLTEPVGEDKALDLGVAVTSDLGDPVSVDRGLV